MMRTLNVIGCGRVGQTLAWLWQQQGTFVVQDAKARTLESSQNAVNFIGCGRAVERLEDMRPADVWMLSVPDTQVAVAAQSLSDALDQDAPPATIFHCSGFLPAAVMSPLRSRGWQLGSAHPALNFASAATGIRQFRGTLCGLEGDEDAVATLKTALETIGGECFSVSGQAKALYHAAAVFSSNFSVVLQGIAQDAWRASGVPDTLIPQLNAALLEATVANIVALGPRAALTGPAARGDTAVVKQQAALVANWNPLAGDAYRAMSELAFRLARTGSTLSTEEPA